MLGGGVKTGTALDTTLGQVLAPVKLRAVVLHHHPILQLLTLDLIKFLSFDDVLEAALISIALELVKKV